MLEAVSSLTRVPASDLTRASPERALLIGAARRLTDASTRALAAALGITQTAVVRSPAPAATALAIVERTVGDARFRRLHDRDLRTEPRWRWWAHHR